MQRPDSDDFSLSVIHQAGRPASNSKETERFDGRRFFLSTTMKNPSALFSKFFYFAIIVSHFDLPKSRSLYTDYYSTHTSLS